MINDVYADPAEEEEGCGSTSGVGEVRTLMYNKGAGSWKQ